MAVLKYKKKDGTYATLTNISVKGVDPVQTTGSSVTDVMSQNAVTVELAGKLAVSDFNTYSGTVDTSISGKASQGDLNALSGTVTAHTADTTIHVISSDKEKWNNVDNKVDTSAYTAYTSATETVINGKVSTEAFNAYSGEVETAINSKALQSDLNALNSTVTAHTSDATIHLTSGNVQTQINDSISGKADTTAVTVSIEAATSGKVDTDTFNTHTGSSVHMSTTEKTNLDSLATNIAAISGITSTKVGNWDTAYTNNHTHSNKSTLDAITASSEAINSLTGTVGTMAFQNTDSYSSATQVKTALAGKSDTGHTHSQYLTEITSNDVTTALGFTPADNSSFTAHTANTTIHVVSSDKTKWDKVTEKVDTTAYTAYTSATETEISGKLSTSDFNTYSGAVDTAISNKVDKVSGKGLSTNDFTTVYKDKLDSVASGAEVNVQSDWAETATTADSYIQNKPTLGTAAAKGVSTGINNTDSLIESKHIYSGVGVTISYDSGTKYIQLKSTSGNVLSSFDASSFIKDGMVSDVEVKDVAGSGTCLVVSFNTDSGKENINIPITDIFNASNYYTKDELTGSSAIAVAKASSATTAASASAVAWSGVTSKPETATRWPSWSEVTSKPETFTPSTHNHDDRYYTESELTGSSTTVVVAKAASATTAASAAVASSVAWNNVSGKPDTYAPSAHNHVSSEITGMTSYSKPSTTSAIVSGDTLNQAIGKLEKALDGKQASGNYVIESTFNTHTGSSVHMTTTEKTNLDSLAANIAAISGITSTKVSNWDTAYTNNHTHTNKSVLDGISASDITNWNNKTSNTGTVTKISTASGLTGGDITTSGTIGLEATGTAGTYKQVVVDAYGRVTSGNTDDNDTNYYTTGLTVSTATTSNTITVKGNNSAVTGSAVLNTATTSAAGLMSSTDKGYLNTLSNLTGKTSTLSAITASAAAINSLTGAVGTMAFQDNSSYSSATQVNTALAGKSNTGHTHDDRYYTESELTGSSTTVVVAKAASATTAASANAVAWNNVSDKPSSYTPSAHNQASNTINSMSGYSVASASGSVATTDTLNEAIGKLEKRIQILEAAIGGMKLVKLTSQQYADLTTKDDNTLYVIND